MTRAKHTLALDESVHQALEEIAHQRRRKWGDMARLACKEFVDRNQPGIVVAPKAAAAKPAKETAAQIYARAVAMFKRPTSIAEVQQRLGVTTREAAAVVHTLRYRGDWPKAKGGRRG